MSRKKKGTTMLPELKDITVLQSNRITNARYDFSLIQDRVFTWVMYHLQHYIKKVMNGTVVSQLDIFNQQVSSYIIPIPLHIIGKPNHYSEIRNAIEKISTIPIRMNDIKKDTVRIAGLFASVEMPDKETNKRSNMVSIEMREDVIKLLIDVDKNTQYRPKEYTSYMLHIAITAKNKYTSKIYKLLCSWREKGGYRVTIENFRDFLQLDNMYPNFNDLKRFILIPVQQELQTMGDLWFNVKDREFEVKEGKKVVGLSFKIIQPTTDQVREKRINHIFWLLRTKFQCTDAHCEKIRSIFTPECDYKAVISKIEYVERMSLEKYSIDKKAAYLVKALLNEFGEDKGRL